MAVTPYLGLSSPLASLVAGWIARIKADLNIIDQAFAGVAGGGANLLVNPGFGTNQRGQSSYTGHATYTLDRWQISYVGAVTLVVSPDGTQFAELSAGSAKCVFTLGGGTYATLEQLVESWVNFRGQTVTLRKRVKCATAGAVRLVISDGVGSSFSAYHSGSNAWETLAVTRAVDAAASTLKAAAYFSSDCTAYVDNATLALGSTPLPYAPLGTAEAQRRCERYYEVHGGSTGFPYVRGYSAVGAGDLAAVAIPWREKKGGAPTVTKAGTWAVNNAGQPTITNANQDGYTLQIASAATGYFDAAPNSADDVITAEWNPS